MDRLLALPDNWDGYGSPAITPAARDTTRHLVRHVAAFRVPVPKLVATPCGGLQWEWRLSGRELELEVRPSGQVEYLAVASDREREGPVSSTDELRHLLRELVSPSEWVEAHYRQRFGGTSIPDEQLRALNFRLDALKLSLQGKP